MEIDHIDPAADDGGNQGGNAIPVCFDCHAEIHSYNPNHPKGRKFTPEELRGHRDQWLELCRARPEILVAAPRDTDAGPLQALLNELEFNAVVSSRCASHEYGCLFKEEQFVRAIQQGSIWILDENPKRVLLEAYAAIGRANALLATEWQQQTTQILTARHADTQKAVAAAGPMVKEALKVLAKYLDFDVP